MRPVILLALLALATPATADYCTGKSDCRACRTCKQCKLCNNFNGPKCGVWKKVRGKAVKAKPRPQKPTQRVTGRK